MNRINVYIKPGAKMQKVIVNSDLDGKKTYAVSVKSLPIEGAANKELLEVLSEYFKVSKNDVVIKSGFNSRYKIVSIPVI